MRLFWYHNQKRIIICLFMLLIVGVAIAAMVYFMVSQNAQSKKNQKEFNVCSTFVSDGFSHHFSETKYNEFIKFHPEAQKPPMMGYCSTNGSKYYVYKNWTQNQRNYIDLIISEYDAKSKHDSSNHGRYEFIGWKNSEQKWSSNAISLEKFNYIYHDQVIDIYK